MGNSLLVGIAGGSGSGKTWLASAILRQFGPSRATLVSQDWYYRDLSRLEPARATQTNFDHPDAIEFDLLAQQLDTLAAGQPIEAPQYQFNTFSRRPESRRLEPAPLVVVEGLFVLAEPRIRKCLDLAVYVDTPEALRLERRLARDQAERGYPRELILEFWQERALPMHERFVEPSRARADLIWDSAQDTAFVPQFLADLQERLASYGAKENPERQGLD